MANELKGKRVAFLFTEGAEQLEVTAPLEAVRKAGADTEIISLEKGEVEMCKHFDKGDKSPPIRPSRTPTPRTTTGSCCQVAWPTRTSCALTRTR